MAGSLTLIPVFVMVHPPLGHVARDFFVPALPANAPLSEVMLLIIAIVGTTVAPWQLFFQQSYVIDKRITPRFIRYERADLWLGIVLVIAGAVAMIAFSAQAFHGTPGFGQYTDALGTAVGLEKHAGRWAGILFAIALLDASIIGACAVSLSTAYAIGDVLAVRHSLHRKLTEAKGFYAVYFGLTLLAAGLVLTPGVPLGLLTNAVQSLAGVLLPSATVFLLLLCNDKAVLGPWTNTRLTNLFTGAVVAVLVMLSVILTAAVLFPNIGTDRHGGDRRRAGGRLPDRGGDVAGAVAHRVPRQPRQRAPPGQRAGPHPVDHAVAGAADRCPADAAQADLDVRAARLPRDCGGAGAGAHRGAGDRVMACSCRRRGQAAVRVARPPGAAAAPRTPNPGPRHC